MSMNLHARCSIGAIDLWQTPTQITHMILVGSDGKIGTLTGKEAKRALYAYAQWVSGTLNGRWNSQEELDTQRAIVENHIEYVLSFIDSKKLQVYQL